MTWSHTLVALMQIAVRFLLLEVAFLHTVTLVGLPWHPKAEAGHKAAACCGEQARSAELTKANKAKIIKAKEKFRMADNMMMAAVVVR
jgi:hypothetical protein